jgi:nicotinate-nucleotide adenylyltransferase
MIGLLGGTFDPVHHGHLRIALDARELLGLDQVRLVPLREAVHRDQPGTPGWLRRDMIAAALAGRSDLCLDDRELRREGPSYTVETLRSLAAESPGERLCLLVGDDAFAGFPDWRAPNEILGLANIAVLRRPGHTATATPGAAELLQRHGVARLDPARTGQIVTCPVTQLAISASDIRARVAAGRSADFLVPPAVAELIRRHHLYVTG